MNMDEVVEVVDALAKAEARQRGWLARQASLAEAWQVEAGQLQQAQAQHAQVGQQLASLRAALESL